MNQDLRAHATRIEEVVRGRRAVQVKFHIGTPEVSIAMKKWPRGTTCSMETADGENLDLGVEFALPRDQGATVSARVHKANLHTNIINNLQYQNVIITQKHEANEHLRRFRLHTRELPPTTEAPALRAYAAAIGGPRIISMEIDNDPTIIKFGNLTLSAEQSQFIRTVIKLKFDALALDCAFGTGKTTTAILGAIHYGKAHPQRKMIFTGITNACQSAAVATLQGFPEGKLRAVRMVSSETMNTMDGTGSTTLDYPRLWKNVFAMAVQDNNTIDAEPNQWVVLAARHLRGQGMLNEDLINPTLSAAVKLPYTSIPKEMTILRVFMNIHDPQLVIGTAAAIKLAFSQAPFLEIKDRFDITFIDEASQLALYVLGSLATMLPKSRMILVGDMHQLPPYMEEALPAELKRAAIGEPLTLAVKGRRWPSMHLTRVHRCPKMITEVLGDLFYGNTLTSSKPGVTDIPVLKAMGLPSRHPMVFVNYTSPQTAVGKSFSNEGEARYALQLVEALTRYASTANKKITAAILNFYGAQYSYVYSMAEDEVTVNRRRSDRRRSPQSSLVNAT